MPMPGRVLRSKDREGNDLQIGKVGLPQLIDCRRLVPGIVSGLYDNERRAGNQIMGFEQTIEADIK
jgi:hypothetical protein